jgi:hypothetical protein
MLELSEVNHSSKLEDGRKYLIKILIASSNTWEIAIWRASRRTFEVGESDFSWGQVVAFLLPDDKL